MSITFTTNFLNQLKLSPNLPNAVMEVALDSGAVKWGFSPGGFTDVVPILGAVSSFQNKLDTKNGFSTRGQITFTVGGRGNFKNVVANNYLKNRRVTWKQGFVAAGFGYTDYAGLFAGRILDWSRKGDDLTVTVTDDLIDATKKLPVENASKTQCTDFRNTNPADIMSALLTDGTKGLGISSSFVNTAQFASERDNWLNGWAFDRVITDPKAANEHLNELQEQTNSFLFNDGSQISFKVFAPPLPSASVQEWTDSNNILKDSFSEKSGCQDSFFNRIVFYYDYDESQQDNEANYESAYIAADAVSQGSSQWNEIKSKVIMSKWVRSFTHSETANITGMKIYHVSKTNGAGAGTLTYNRANNTLQYTAPGGSIGAAVKLSRDGRYQVFDADQAKYVRVVITAASLPGTNQTDTVTITTLPGAIYAATVANKLLNRYRDAVPAVSMEVDINDIAYGPDCLKVTDYKDITTDEACKLGAATWSKERVMVTSVRPDFQAHKITVEAIGAAMKRRYGFIAPSGYPDYPSATAAQRKYAFIGDGNNKVNGGTEDGYYCW